MKWYDFTLPINSKTPVFEGSRGARIHRIASLNVNGWNESRIAINNHFSTHIDVPSHMVSGGKTLSDFNIAHFCGRCYVFDVVGQNPIVDIDTSIINENDIVFFYTGHSELIGSSKYTDNYPTIDLSLVDKLIDSKIKIVGFDTLGPDTKPFPVHKRLLKEEILILENIVNLKNFINSWLYVIIAPLFIDGADGAPARVIACKLEDLNP
jgi:arylformamidase